MFIREKRICTLGTARSHSAASMDVYIFVIDPRVYRTHAETSHIHVKFAFIYIYLFDPGRQQADGPTNGQTGRQTDRQTGRQTDRQNDRQTHTHIQNTYLPT